jgi:hypothetical protein
MNNLTNYLTSLLIEEETKKTVAVYAGGFKPPTKGHFDVVKQALTQNPTIDTFIIYTGSGVRDGITQSESIQVWEMYKKYLPFKVEIEPSKAPIKSVLNYAKENPSTTVLWVIGAREENPDDWADISSRTRTLDKYPNLHLRVIQTKGGISGTAARKALRDNNKELFFKLIPDIKEKEQVWDIMFPLIKEIVNNTNNSLDLKENYQFKVSDKVYDEEDNSLISVDYEFSTPYNDYRAEFYSGEYSPESKIFDVSFGIDKSGSKLDTSQMTGEGNALSILKTIVDIIKDFTKRFEVNKLVINPTNEKRGKIYAMVLKLLPSNILNKVELINKNQVVTVAESFYLNIPKFNQPKTIQQHLIENINEISLSKENAVKINGDLTGGTFTVGDVTYEYNIKNIPNPYKDLGLFYNIQFTPSGEITSIPKGGKENYIKILSTMYKIIVDFIEKEQPTYVGISSLDNNGDKNYHTVYNRLTSSHMNFVPGYFRKDSNLTFDSPQGKGRFIVLKKKDSLDEKKSKNSFGLKSYVHELVTDTEVICDNCGWEWKIADGGDDLYTCHKCEHDNTPSSTQINENQQHVWNIKEAFVSLVKYMINNDMNIEPLPKIKVINDDEKNASDLLGKTAYYNPSEKSITLYTLDRHPKDILRSFCHEIIHHVQNLEGRLNNINTTNTNEDGDLPEIEREAYEKGNMLFRNWEDSIKAEKYLNEYKQKFLTELEETVSTEPIQQYTIYCDMDGVLVDFNEGYKNLVGVDPSTINNQEMFWDPIAKKGAAFWITLKWMQDGKQLWDYIKKYNPKLLSAPSREESSQIGKRVWVKRELPGTKLILRSANKKQQFASPTSILIDDRVSNINQWIESGGIGILHTDTQSTIEQLKSLGL